MPISLRSLRVRLLCRATSGRRPRGPVLEAEQLESRAVMAVVVAGPVATVPDLAAESDSGWSRFDNKTSIQTPVFSGFAAGAVSVNLYDGKVLIGSAAVAEGSNQWVFTAAPLAAGKHSIGAQAVDAAGRAGKVSKRIAVEIGTARPAPAALALESKSDSGLKLDGRTNVAAPRIAGRAAAGAAVVLRVDDAVIGSVPVGRKGTWSVQLPTLADGPHTVTSVVENVFGLQSDAFSRTIVIDTVRPTAALAYVPETGDVVVTFSRPVAGMSVKNMRIAGQTASGLTFDLPLTASTVKSRVGSITIIPSSDSTTYTLRTQGPLLEQGTYTLTLHAARSGIVDAVAGNLLLGNASASTTL